METGLCLRLLWRLASASGSARCCQQLTLARNSWGEVTDSFLTGTDLEDEVLRMSEVEEEDLTESRRFSSLFDEDFFTTMTCDSDFSSCLLSEVVCFHSFLSSFIWRGTEARR